MAGFALTKVDKHDADYSLPIRLMGGTIDAPRVAGSEPEWQPLAIVACMTPIVCPTKDVCHEGLRPA